MLKRFLLPLAALLERFLLWLWRRKPAKVTYIPRKPTPAITPREVAEADADTRSVIVEAEEALDEGARDVEDWTDAGDDAATRGR